jgi:hypothetical protein
MKRYYCNGKKGYCDRGNDNNIDCRDCEFANGTGGEEVDIPDTNYERIRNMSVEESADKLFGGKTFCPHLTYWNMSRCAKRSCTECIKEWLEEEVEE